MIFALRVTNKLFQQGIRETSWHLEMFFHLPFPHCPLMLVFCFLLAKVIYLDANSLDLIKKANTCQQKNFLKLHVSRNKEDGYNYPV